MTALDLGLPPRTRSQIWWSYVTATTIAVAGTALGIAGLRAKAADASHSDFDVAIGGTVGFLFLLTGAVANVMRHPARRSGMLMMMVGLGWFAEDIQFTNNPWLHVIAAATSHAATPIAAHLILAFPAGRLTTRLQRVLVVSGYLVAFGGPLLRALVTRPESMGLHTEPVNLLLMWDRPDLSILGKTAINAAGTIIAIAVVAILVQRWRKATPRRKAYSGAIFAAGLACAMMTAVGVVGYQHPLASTVLTMYKVTLCLVPLALLAVILELRIGPTRSHGVLRNLTALTSSAAVQEMLRHGLLDSGLRLLLVSEGDPERLMDIDGKDAKPQDGAGISQVLLDDVLLGVVEHDPALFDDPTRLHGMINAAAASLHRARLTAEVRASRERIHTASVEAQARIARDLHDGAQQGLVSLKLLITLASGEFRAGHTDSGHAVLDQALDLTAKAYADLKDLVRGVQRHTLLQFGLSAAITEVASEVPQQLSVTLTLRELPRFADVVEGTALFVVQEAITNTIKHADAKTVAISADHSDGQLRVTVTDDGKGGADVVGFHGIRGIADRVAAFGGSLEVNSPKGGGTSIIATLTCEPISERGQS